MYSTNQHVLNKICQEVRQDMANKGKKDNEIDWDVNVEVLFFLAMMGLKPVGVNKHFMMLLVHHKFSSYLDHQISSKLLWDHLDTLYDMAALHESEIIPFPNEEIDFELPEDCYDLAKSKLGISFKHSNSDTGAVKNGSNPKLSKKMVAPKFKQSSMPVMSKTSVSSTLLNKSLKSQTVMKSETKISTSDGSPKVKLELGPSVKINKIKRSSSPVYNKIVKSESKLSYKEGSPDIISVKKYKERSNSPATNKKFVKIESSSTIAVSKRPTKNETAPNVSKSSKEQTSDLMKKVRIDKDVYKKFKSAEIVTVYKKCSKDDVSFKKKNESESIPKKTSETSFMRNLKCDIKSSVLPSKGHDIETYLPSGSRKSFPIVKLKNCESKKFKIPKPEEPPKPLTVGPKRRRAT